jgi:hypothetical protein
VVTVSPEAGPKVEGLVGRMDGDILKYYAEAGNKYGLEADAYAGEFRPNVLVSGERTGGLVLTASVAETILREELAKIENPDDRWLIPLPGDISVLDNNEEVSLNFERGFGRHNVLMAVLSYKGIIPLVSDFLGVTKVDVFKNSYYGWLYYDSIRNMDPYTDKIFSGKEMSYINVLGNFLINNETAGIPVSFGERITESEDKIIVYLGAATEWREMKIEKILSNNGIPIFVSAS